ncbi:hypothetical protein APR11_002474 [Nocardia amikacinitolerans]|nr:hypothetical protein [Nocardia amikacinitolerans]
MRVEVVNHLPHISFRDLHQLRDRPDRLMLGRGHHHHRPPHPHRHLATPGDLGQLATLLRSHRSAEHIRLASHRHHLHRQHCRSRPPVQPATPAITASTFPDKALDGLTASRWIGAWPSSWCWARVRRPKRSGGRGDPGDSVERNSASSDLLGYRLSLPSFPTDSRGFPTSLTRSQQSLQACGTTHSANQTIGCHACRDAPERPSPGTQGTSEVVAESGTRCLARACYALPSGFRPSPRWRWRSCSRCRSLAMS